LFRQIPELTRADRVHDDNHQLLAFFAAELMIALDLLPDPLWTTISGTIGPSLIRCQVRHTESKIGEIKTPDRE
jgi:hypothetical protein